MALSGLPWYSCDFPPGGWRRKHICTHEQTLQESFQVSFLQRVSFNSGFSSFKDQEVHRMSFYYCRDFMGPNLDETVRMLSYLYPLIGRANKQLRDFIERYSLDLPSFWMYLGIIFLCMPLFQHWGVEYLQSKLADDLVQPCSQWFQPHSAIVWLFHC